MESRQTTFETMGTVATIDVRDGVDNATVEHAFAAIRSRLADIDARFSTYRADSEISRMGRGELLLEDASDDVRFILDLCDKLHNVSGGTFDVHAAATRGPAVELQKSLTPGAKPLEPSGAVKGWAIEVVSALLQADGMRDFCVNIGGDVYASGRQGADEGWRVGLQHPYERMKVMAVLEVRDTAVATSALYERGDHIIVDEGITPLVSVTVVGPDITLADAYATIAFAKGVEGLAWITQQPGFEVFAVDQQQQTHFSPGLRSMLRDS